MSFPTYISANNYFCAIHNFYMPVLCFGIGISISKPKRSRCIELQLPSESVQNLSFSNNLSDIRTYSSWHNSEKLFSVIGVQSRRSSPWREYIFDKCSHSKNMRFHCLRRHLGSGKKWKILSNSICINRLAYLNGDTNRYEI